MTQHCHYHRDVRQNTDEWMRLHAGRLTASGFCNFITPAKLVLSKSATARRYIVRKAMEAITQRTERQVTSRPMQHGHDVEGHARSVYGAITGRMVDTVGFVTLTNEPLIGCSPDGLIGDDGGLEIKSHWTLAEAGLVRLDGIPPEHYLQVMGSLWITGRQWWDYLSYLDEELCDDVRTAAHIIRLERDDEAIEKIAAATFSARDWMFEILSELKGRGNVTS